MKIASEAKGSNRNHTWIMDIY